MSNRAVTILTAGSLTAGLLTGILIGRASASNGETSTPKPKATHGQALDPKSYPRTKEGAATAAQAYYDALVASLFSDPAQRRTVLAAISTDAMRDQIVKRQDEGAALTAKLFDLPKDQGLVVNRITPLGYRVASFTKDSARVEIWSTGVFGKPAVGHGIAPQYKTATFDLGWERSAWRLAGEGEIKDGPTPVTDSPEASTQILTSVKNLQEFSHVAR